MDEELMIKVLIQWDGTEESFGATLYEATKWIPSWYIGPDRKDAIRKKQAARNLIIALDGGRELLKQEEKFLRQA